MKKRFSDLARSTASVVFWVVFLRSFVVEAYKIPSGSMIPTLQVGDRIFVNKFIYGLRLPLTHFKMGAEIRPPHRGEVIVFLHPTEDRDYIKRVVATPGDRVEIRDNTLYVNGQAVERRHVDQGCTYEDYLENEDRWEERDCDAFSEKLEGKRFVTLFNPNFQPSSFGPVTVPDKQVFVLGDNRDNSNDSRYWGFVPYGNIEGRAMFVWWSTGEPEGLRLKRFFSAVR
jgi:signal peptidase I